MPDPTIHRAIRLPELAGAAAWDSILGPRAVHPPLAGATTADVVIIGGGFAGLSAAQRLLQIEPTARIVIVDATRIGQGSAGRNSGFMIDLPHELTSDDYAGQDAGSDQTLICLNRQAIAFAADNVREYNIPAHYFQRDGKVNGAVSVHAQEQAVAYGRHLEGMEEKYEILDAQAMRALTGSDYYRSGLYTPGTVLLQPAGYIRGLLGGLAGQVAVYENTPVLKLAREGGGWSVETAGGRIAAGAVILANNGHLESFGFATRRLMHVFLFACMTEELPPESATMLGGRERWGITPSDPMGTTIRRFTTDSGRSRIVVRTMSKFVPDMRTSPRQMRKAVAMMRGKFDVRFPALSAVKMEFSWAGHLCLTRNNSSLAGQLDDNLFAGCICNGLGTTRSTLAGIAAAEAAAGQESAVTRFFAGQQLPRRLPPAPLAQIGANMVLGWKEWRARRE